MDQAVSQGHLHEIRNRPGPELGQDIVFMGLDSLGGDAQPRGDVPDGSTIGNQSQDFPFSGGKRRERVIGLRGAHFLQDGRPLPVRIRESHEDFSPAHGVYGLEQAAGAVLLAHIAPDSRMKELEQIAAIVVTGIDDHPAFRSRFEDAPAGLHAANTRHGKIKKTDVGSHRGGRRNGLLSADGLSSYAQVRIRSQQATLSLHKEAVVIHKKYPRNLFHSMPLNKLSRLSGMIPSACIFLKVEDLLDTPCLMQPDVGALSAVFYVKRHGAPLHAKDAQRQEVE